MMMKKMRGKGLYILAGIVAVLCIIPSPYDKRTTTEVYHKPIIITQGKAETVKAIKEIKQDEPEEHNTVGRVGAESDTEISESQSNVTGTAELIGYGFECCDNQSVGNVTDYIEVNNNAVDVYDESGTVEDVQSNDGAGISEYTDVEEEFVEEPQEVLTYVGDWTVTFYDDCPECVGQYAGMMQTASGNVPTAGWTVAAGPSYPFGTILYIEGFGYYEVQDRGVSDGWVDIYVNDHSEIPSYGMTSAAVYIVEG